MSAKEAYPEILREFHRMVLLPHELVTLVSGSSGEIYKSIPFGTLCHDSEPIWHRRTHFVSSAS